MTGFQFAAITAFYRWVRIVRMKESLLKNKPTQQ